MERTTRQRAAIRSAIDAARRPLSPPEVLQASRAEVPGLGMATVYRALKRLSEAGEIQVVSLPGESPRYESGGHDHHHHFHCDRCDRVFDVPDCPGSLEALAPAGFSVERHEITLYGHCKDCAPRRKRPSAAHP